MDVAFDLDGTVLDVSERYYFVHCQSAQAAQSSPLGMDRYLQLRKDGWDEKKIAGLTGGDLRAHMDSWDSLIESDKALEKDRPAVGIRECLDRLQASHVLHLVTLRRRPELLCGQLAKHGLEKYFAKVIAGGPEGDPAEFKAGLLAASGVRFDALVGDTEVDIKTAKILGTRFIAATYGLRDEKFLKENGAKIFAASPAQVMAALRNYI